MQNTFHVNNSVLNDALVIPFHLAKRVLQICHPLHLEAVSMVLVANVLTLLAGITLSSGIPMVEHEDIIEEGAGKEYAK